MRIEFDNGAPDRDRHLTGILRRMRPIGDRDNGPPGENPTQGILR